MGLFGFISDARTAMHNLAKPDQVYLEPGALNMPATTGGQLYEPTEFDGIANGNRRYAEIVVTNNAEDYVELVKPSGAVRRIFPGQSITQSFTPPARWWAIKPNSTTTAGDVVIVPKLVVL